MRGAATTLRFQLTCLVAAAVLPIWIASAVLLFHAYSVKRDQVKDTMLERAQSLTMVVDRELTGVQSALQALATSPAFAAGDFAGIHRQALELLKSYPAADIIVADQNGQQLVNSFRPLGTPLPKRKNLDPVRRIFQTGKPVISDLFYGTVTRRPLIGIDVPVLVDGRVTYDLGMTFPSDRLAAILLSQNLPPDQYAAILDRRLTLVARSRDNAHYVGRHATADVQRALAQHSAGTLELNNLGGTRVLDAYCRSPLSGWSVVMGVPKASVMAAVYRWIGWVVAGVALISLFGVSLAFFYARRISRSIQSLVGPALTIGRGGLLDAVGSHAIKETGEVAAALVQASDLLQARHGELRDSERRYSSLFANKLSGMAHCRVITDGEGVPVDYWILQVNEAYERILGIGKADIEGRTVREVFPGVEHFDFDYIGVLGRLGLEGGEILTETYLETTGQYLQISAYSPGPGEFTAMLTDITEHKRVENDLRRAMADAERFREALDHVPACIYMKDTQSRYTYGNRLTLDIFRCSAPELVGCEDSAFFPAVTVTYLHEMDSRVFQGEQTTDEIDFLDAQGERRVYMDFKTPVYEDPERRTICGLLGISTDITERKQAAETLERQVAERTASLTRINQQLRMEIAERARMEDELLEYQQGLEALTQELSLTEERERGRIAGELHDQVGQHLILGKMKLQWLANELSAEHQSVVAEDIDRLLSQAIQDIRSLTFQLRPPILANAGLEAALIWLGEELKDSYGLRTEFSDDGQPKPLRYEYRSVVFQAVREFLINVAKHSGSQLALVDMRRTGGNLVINVADTGTGFDPAQVVSGRSGHGGYGLFNVRKKIEYLGGGVGVQTEVGRGTRVTLTIPLDDPETDKE